MSNPYTLVFGQPPVENIERTSQTERIISEFCQDRPSNYINLITGIRGCGKTVLAIYQLVVDIYKFPKLLCPGLLMALA